MSARSRELLGLLPVSLMVTAGFTAVLITRSETVETVTLTYGAFFLGCCLLAHLFIRARLPDADPYLFPLAALLAAFGLVMVYRIDEELAREQAQWFVIGLALFVATIVLLRDHRVLERYRYLIAVGGILLLLAPRLPGIGAQVNGAFLAVDFGPLRFQPAEFAKLAIIVFLASYLNDTRDVLLRSGIDPPPLSKSLPLFAAAAGLGALLIFVLDYAVFPSLLIAAFAAVLVALVRERPSLKHFGPLLLVWGLAMFLLFFIRDLGSSLMFFGGFLALVYVATARLSFVALGSLLFVGGSTFLANTVGHVRERVDVWLDPFAKSVEAEGYQIRQSLFAQADGGLFGQGFGQSLLELPGCAKEDLADFPNKCSILPAPHTDLIYAVIVNEVGLFGAVGIVIVCLLFAARAFRTGVMAEDGFSKLLATGLAAVFALQVFVIVGGVVKAIPLTGVTLPFISAGGSSLLANFVLLALLLIVSDHARRDAQRAPAGGLL